MTTEDRATCRDYERGVCNRGDKCRYNHPEGVKPSDNQKLPICKDYQNKGCSRMKCKFLHVTVDEEAEYMKTGTLPEHGGRPDLTVAASQQYSHAAGKEICKDYLNNICDRGSRCKFLHTPDPSMGGRMAGQLHGLIPMHGKRFRDNFGGMSGSPDLMEENEMLQRKITDLQKQVVELRQMNDTLYDQNTRYRAQLQQGKPTLASSPQRTDAYSKPVLNGSVSTSTTPTYMMPAPAPPPYNYSQLR